MANTEHRPGMMLMVGDAVPKSAPTFAETQPEYVFGALPCKGKPTSIAGMDVGVTAEAKRRFRQGDSEQLLRAAIQHRSRIIHLCGLRGL